MPCLPNNHDIPSSPIYISCIFGHRKLSVAFSHLAIVSTPRWIQSPRQPCWELGICYGSVRSQLFFPRLWLSFRSASPSGQLPPPGDAHLFSLSQLSQMMAFHVPPSTMVGLVVVSVILLLLRFRSCCSG